MTQPMELFLSGTGNQGPTSRIPLPRWWGLGTLQRQHFSLLRNMMNDLSPSSNPFSPSTSAANEQFPLTRRHMQHDTWPQLRLKPRKNWLENYSAVGWERRTDVAHFFLGKGGLQGLQTSSGISQSQGKVQSCPKKLQVVYFNWPHPLLLEKSGFPHFRNISKFPFVLPWNSKSCFFSKFWQFQKLQWALAQPFLGLCWGSYACTQLLGGVCLPLAELSYCYLGPTSSFWLPLYPSSELQDAVPWWLKSRGSFNGLNSAKVQGNESLLSVCTPIEQHTQAKQSCFQICLCTHHAIFQVVSVWLGGHSLVSNRERCHQCHMSIWQSLQSDLRVNG